ncbi:hypothetical protein EKH55_4139 [Sinorhizobium alkalisoli]|nr:hypothetical protein EKH55_4139 [Sinorhizobium alkalisoli]
MRIKRFGNKARRLRENVRHPPSVFGGVPGPQQGRPRSRPGTMRQEQAKYLPGIAAKAERR